LASNRIQQAWELDIPNVAASKRIMLERLFQRRNIPMNAPQLSGVDLNDLDLVQTTLGNIAKDDKRNEWHTIVVSEAVLMYLDEGVPSKVIKACRSVFGRKGTASFCFADRLEGVPQDGVPQQDEDAGRRFLSSRMDWWTGYRNLGVPVIWELLIDRLKFCECTSGRD
jgi:O-methyltransferase involved in polyketide biosynthesis